VPPFLRRALAGIPVENGYQNVKVKEINRNDLDSLELKKPNS
jgi:hypothetical protein